MRTPRKYQPPHFPGLYTPPLLGPSPCVCLKNLAGMPQTQNGTLPLPMPPVCLPLLLPFPVPVPPLVLCPCPCHCPPRALDPTHRVLITLSTCWSLWPSFLPHVPLEQPVLQMRHIRLLRSIGRPQCTAHPFRPPATHETDMTTQPNVGLRRPLVVSGLCTQRQRSMDHALNCAVPPCETQSPAPQPQGLPRAGFVPLRRRRFVLLQVPLPLPEPMPVPVPHCDCALPCPCPCPFPAHSPSTAHAPAAAVPAGLCPPSAPDPSHVPALSPVLLLLPVPVPLPASAIVSAAQPRTWAQPRPRPVPVRCPCRRQTTLLWGPLSWWRNV